MISLSRKQNLAEKIVFVDGLPGCGKTLFSSLISSFDKVELLSYAYEVEHSCSLYCLNQLNLNSAANLIRLYTDLKIYNMMMGRDVNFRAQDLSSATNYHTPNKYIERLSGPGDKEIPSIIEKEKPILNLTVHNLLAFSEPIWDGIGKRCVFIEIIRHPLYMIRQQALNMNSLLETPRDFSIYYSHKGRELPFYVKDWEDEYLTQNAYERSICFINKYNQRLSNLKLDYLKKHMSKIITIPFELFVLNPKAWIQKIENILETKTLENINDVLKRQKVPRKKIADGIDIDIYRRCGWEPPKDEASERDELLIRREEIVRNISSDMTLVLDKICRDYEKKYWHPDE